MTILEIILICCVVDIIAGLVAISIWKLKVEKSNILFIEEMWLSLLLWPIMTILPFIKYVKRQIRHMNLGTRKD